MIINSLFELDEISKKVASLLKEGDVLFLYGDLGTGKTQFTKFLLNNLGYSGDVTSPTFSIVNLYEADILVTHMDLYRLNSLDEAINIGIYDILDDDSLKIIEWPDIIPELEDYADFKIYFDYLDDKNKREIIINDRSGEILL